MPSRRILRAGSGALVLALVASCGGGGGGGAPASPPATLTYASPSMSVRVDSFVPGNAPTTTGGAPTPPQTGSGVSGDAYVRGGQYATANYGSASELVIKFSADLAYMREAYMTLDISTVQPGQSVRLRLFGKLSDNRAVSVTTAIVPLATSSWSESSVTWNTRPAAGSATWATVAVSGTTGQWYEVDITSRRGAVVVDYDD